MGPNLPSTPRSGTTLALDRFRKRRDEEPPDGGQHGGDPGEEARRAAEPASGADLIDAMARDRERVMNGEISSDEYRHRVAVLLRDASPDEIAATSAGLSSTSEFSHVRASAEAGGFAPARGAAPMSVARTAAIERLTELRAAGKIDEESFLREKERLSRYGQ